MSYQEFKTSNLSPVYEHPSNSIEEELQDVNRRLEYAQHQENARKKGFVTTCIYHDTNALEEKRRMLELMQTLRR